MWSNTRRGAQFLDGTVPKLIRAIEALTKALQSQAEPPEDRNEIARQVLHAALNVEGGRSVHLAEVIDDLERKASQSADLKSVVKKVLDLSTAHVPSVCVDWGNLRVLEQAHGWAVYCTDCEEGVPDWFLPILRAANQQECLLVHFDGDAEKVDCFETWEW